MSDLLRDAARLDALRRSGLMDSEPEEVFDRLTRLAAKLLGTPVATVTLVDDSRQYFKSSVGAAVNETPLSHSFCRYVVTGGAPLIVTDSNNQERTVTATPYSWNLTLYVPQGKNFGRYEINFIGLTREQYLQDKSVLEVIIDSLRYDPTALPATQPM